MKKEKMWTNNYKTADYILAVGDRKETFDFVLERFRENKKIIHLWAGEISQGTHDEIYRHTITLMSCIQLCTNQNAVYRVISLCDSVNKIPNVYIVGNIMLDNLEIDETNIPKEPYDLILYNPPTNLTKKEICDEILYIRKMLFRKYIWIEPNGDYGSELIQPNVTHSTLPRKIFLGFLKNCCRFITNSSCMYYEAPFLIDKKQIIPIGIRNQNRESKYSNMNIKNASDNVIKIFRKLK